MPRQLCVSPVGEAAWAKVFQPDYGFDKNSRRCWSITLLLDTGGDECIQFVDQLERIFAEIHGANAKAAQRGWPFADEVDRDGNLTGRFRFRFKRNETTARGMVMAAPVVVDAKRQLWNPDVLIGNGSRVKVAFSPWGWSGQRHGEHGLSLNLESVQVLDLVEYERLDPISGFSEEEGFTVGPYVSEPAEEPFVEASQASSIAERLRQRAAPHKDLPTLAATMPPGRLPDEADIPF